MLPYNPGFDLNRLNALRQAIYGHPGGISPTWGMGPGVMGGAPVQGSPVARAPMQAPVASPMMQAPAMQNPQFANLNALRSLGPQYPTAQNNLRRPIAPQF